MKTDLTKKWHEDVLDSSGSVQSPLSLVGSCEHK